MKLLKLVPDNTNIHFLKWRVPFYVISILLMAASWGLVLTKGLNLGVDFIGGQMIRVTFERSAEAPVGELREEVAKLGYGEPIIQRYGKPNEISIRMKLPEGAGQEAALADKMARTITADIKKNHADARIDGVDSVSGKVSKELGWDAFKALGLASLVVALRMAVRRGRTVRAGSRRNLDARPLCRDRHGVRPEHRGRAPDADRLFAERYDRGL